ncbi:hypothetical protein MKY64_30415 [Paenibacillus sp. FSL R7-0210]|uniref:hypothetical protein n=1 Tax=Paenibacillus sp. FSL R7-0210 TaxID=2921676 RepID=UPI0030FCFE62
MKLIDADKQIEWIKQELDKTPKEWPTSYECGRAAALKEVMKLLEGDRFDPTPPVQPDTEELSQEDIEELSVMFKSMKQSFDSIQGHLNGMNNTLDMFGEVGPPQPPTSATEILINYKANDMAAKTKKYHKFLKKIGVLKEVITEPPYLPYAGSIQLPAAEPRDSTQRCYQIHTNSGATGRSHRQVWTTNDATWTLPQYHITT